MIGDRRLKVCGLTSARDAAAAAAVGADYLGFIFYPKSPRAVTPADFGAMAGELPPTPKVAVCVEPHVADLTALREAGFALFQVHFRADLPLALIEAWSLQVGAEHLWLAPKLPPAADLHPGWLPFARTFLVDTYEADKFGGTGKTGDWGKFAAHQRAHPDHTWILSGGLASANIAEAVAQSGARFVDVNSGVESVPGIKDGPKLQAFAEALRRA